jgi:hypothetical protein
MNGNTEKNVYTYKRHTEWPRKQYDEEVILKGSDDDVLRIARFSDFVHHPVF